MFGFLPHFLSKNMEMWYTITEFTTICGNFVYTNVLIYDLELNSKGAIHGKAEYI